MPAEESLCPPDLPANPPASTDHDDYGHIGPEDFERRIQADNDARNGELIRNAKWEPVGEPAW
ncbi:hypothetical protein HFO56_39270 [Rhizobium laguerreae]|uniref:hypothetical protein n=1 Tax=Rhizobium laguerreae TaxID=1076926 RepID=UPI001C91C332|nr:hypothetical protein [Rhizobium laguerreae]MBY3158342.1 hypothetical protein [Rhizobium laguerreae]